MAFLPYVGSDMEETETMNWKRVHPWGAPLFFAAFLSSGAGQTIMIVGRK